MRENTTVISKREISGKSKFSKRTLTEQHMVELKKLKDGWDVGDKVAIRVGTKLSQIHLTHIYGTLIAQGRRCPQQDSWHTHTTHEHKNN
jgi:hypothetical protein